MYRVLDESSGRAVGIKVQDTLTKDDYEVLIPYFENLIHECGALSLLCEMSEFGRMELDAFWEDFKCNMNHLSDFTRIAILGDQRCLDWSTTKANSLLNTELRYFTLEHRSKAWEWVKA